MHIILYVIDALRSDHLGCYGYERNTSPNIDALASEGVVFNNCYTTTTWTRPVAASILTGVYPGVHKTRHRNERFVSPIIRLPQVLQTHGFWTLGITSMANLAGELGFGRGFDEYIELFRDPKLLKMRMKRDSVRKELLDLLDRDKADIALPLAEDINAKMFPRLKEMQNVDTFNFLWSIEPHAPYSPPDGYRRYSKKSGITNEGWPSDLRSAGVSDQQRLIDLYDDEIYYNDSCIGELVKYTHELGIYDETWFIIVGDHGEAFYEHGVYSHGHAPFEEVIHVPMVMKLPVNQYKSKRIDALVSLLDIYPTLCAYFASNEPSENSITQGTNLMPLIAGEDQHTHGFLFTDSQILDIHNRYQSIMDSHWKYIKIQRPKGMVRTLSGMVRYIFSRGLVFQILRSPHHFLRNLLSKSNAYLFNLDEDPKESNNIKKEYPEIADRLERELTKWQKQNEIMADQIGNSDDNYEESDTLKDHLEKLGYL